MHLLNIVSSILGVFFGFFLVLSCIVFPLCLTFFIYSLFRRRRWMKKGVILDSRIIEIADDGEHDACYHISLSYNNTQKTYRIYESAKKGNKHEIGDLIPVYYCPNSQDAERVDNIERDIRLFSVLTACSLVGIILFALLLQIS